MATLLETYAKPIASADKRYASLHEGQSMDMTRKLVLAACLRNVNKRLHESATQSANVLAGDGTSFQRFTLNLVNASLPNLIAFDLCIVSPMKDWTGHIVFAKYLRGTSKGATKQGDLFNSPFKLGNVDSTYTSNSVVEPFPALAGRTSLKVAFVGNDAKVVKVLENGVEKTAVTGFTISADGTLYDGASSFVADATKEYKVAYTYDNVVIPQNELPTLTMTMDSITLQAKVRRIAITYAQIAQFQAQTEYGLDLNKALAEQATAELQYETDVEICDMLKNAAIENMNGATTLNFALALPVGVSKQEHYASFTEVAELADQIVYQATRKFTCNYMICGSEILRVLRFCPDFKRIGRGNQVGPYQAGTLGDIKVFICPTFAPKEYVFGLNGSDLMTSAAVYAPYMPLIPTQLVQFADGRTETGFSTCYDAKIINKELLVYGQLV